MQAPVKVWRSSIKVSTPTDYGVPLSKPTLQNASNLPTGNWSPALALLETAFCFTLPESLPALPPAIFDWFQEKSERFNGRIQTAGCTGCVVYTERRLAPHRADTNPPAGEGAGQTRQVLLLLCPAFLPPPPPPPPPPPQLPLPPAFQLWLPGNERRRQI